MKPVLRVIETGLPLMTVHGGFATNRNGIEELECQCAAEFQKILDHRGIVVTDPIGAVAHLQRWRAYALTGDSARAKAAYEEFLGLWKDADPDVRILREARTEYAKMQ